MDQLHAADIQVVFCTPTPTPPIWLSHGHPERSFVNSEGQRMIHGARQHLSYEHPVVRKACFRIVKACAKALGKHPSLIGWQIDNELKCHVAEDFSEAAIQSWHQWLEDRYETIDQLNQAWGTDIWSQRYQTFEQVPAPLKTPFLHNASLSTAYRLCSRDRIAEFMDQQCDIIRGFSDKPITHNMSLSFAINHERMSKNLDFVSFDGYPQDDQWQSLVLNCDVFRAAKSDQPFWLMETSASHNGWLGKHQKAHPPGFLVAQAVCAYALGSEAFCYWLWRQQRTGCEIPHSAVMSAWFKPGIGYEHVQGLEAMRKSLEPLLINSRPATAQVSLIWSDLARAMVETEPLDKSLGESQSYKTVISAWHQRLIDLGLHRDVRFEGASLDGVKLLITPVMPFISAQFLARVEAFVTAGGVWICGPVCGTRTQEHTVPTDSGLGAVEALAGVELVFSYPVTGTDAVGKAFGERAPLGGLCSALRAAHTDTRVVGSMQTSLASDVAFLTERRLGRGAVVMLGAQPEGPEGEHLLNTLIMHYAKKAQVDLWFTCSVGTVVCPRVDRQGRALWVVVNMDGKGGEVKVQQTLKNAISGEVVLPADFLVAPYEWFVLQSS
ncbi:MAG: beta-galactosidase [Spongiibacteraceae bacterium]|nr:beta-galactosidase [Spongiibacteraceae bacterium]